MKRIKRYISISLAALILLSFSVTLIPLDFIHNHKTSARRCAQDAANTTCTHKLHISKKADFCWACAVHFDKSFTTSSFVENIKLNPVISIFVENDVTGTIFELIFAGLRGPPVE